MTTLLLVGVTRMVSVHPLVAALFVGLLAVSAAAVAAWRPDGRRQVEGWQLLGVSLVCVAASGVVAAARPPGPSTGLTPGDGLALVGMFGAGTGLVGLLRARIAGRAYDVLIESVMCATAAGLVAWALSMGLAGGSGGSLTILARPMADVIVLWLTIRLVWLTSVHPAAYRYLVGAFVCLLSVDIMRYGGVVGGGGGSTFDPGALALWASCLWAAAAVHPSLRQEFEPVAERPTRLAVSHVLGLLVLVFVGPMVVVIGSAMGTALTLPELIIGLTILPLMVAVYLIRQVQNRAAGEYRAQHDPLTGLPNRVLFNDRVDVALAQAERAGTHPAVMFLDLDRFKSINDSLGHEVGNQVLRGVAHRLRTSLRASDTVARMGGDEFTILVSDVADGDALVALAEVVLRAFREPFAAGKTELITSTSLGIAVFPDDGVDTDTLLKNADTAMYGAKASGRNTYQLYTSDMSARAEVKLSLENNLRQAISRHDLVMYYQPKVDVGTREVVGLEALVRWPHPELGYVSPGAFIPLAEETGQIFALGEWALEEACRQTQAWMSEGLAVVPVAVNLSARQFAQNRVEAAVERALRISGLPAELLELEITESVFLQDLGGASDTLRRLRDIGVRCSIDDFGTGYSGLSYLARMPIDSLKIDQTFVSEIGELTREAPIVEAIIALAHSLHLKVIAEGVETVSQARFLRAHGCDQMQGYLFSPALSPDELERFLMVRSALPGMAADLFEMSCALGFAPPVTALPDRQDISDLLVAICRDSHADAFDQAMVEEALVALRSLEPVGSATPSSFRSASLRLAAGTFVGLLPLSGGLAAAGALPPSTQKLAASIFAAVGVQVPGSVEPDRVSARNSTLAGGASHRPSTGTIDLVLPPADAARGIGGHTDVPTASLGAGRKSHGNVPATPAEGGSGSTPPPPLVVRLEPHPGNTPTPARTPASTPAPRTGTPAVSVPNPSPTTARPTVRTPSAQAPSTVTGSPVHTPAPVSTPSVQHSTSPSSNPSNQQGSGSTPTGTTPAHPTPPIQTTPNQATTPAHPTPPSQTTPNQATTPTHPTPPSQTPPSQTPPNQTTPNQATTPAHPTPPSQATTPAHPTTGSWNPGWWRPKW